MAPSGDRKLYALAALNGNVLWEYDAGDLIVGGAAVVNDVIILNTATGFVNVIDLKSGKRKFFVKVDVSDIRTIITWTTEAYLSI